MIAISFKQILKIAVFAGLCGGLVIRAMTIANAVFWLVLGAASGFLFEAYHR